MLFFFFCFFLPKFSYILPFSPFSIFQRNPLYKFFLHINFCLSGVCGDCILWNFSENSTKRLTTIFEHNIPFRHWPFSLVTRLSLIFWKGLTHIKPFLHVLCYFSSVIGAMHVWKLWCKSEWFEDVSKFSWLFLIFQKGHNTRYRTFLKKSRTSFGIFRKVITEVGPFLKNLLLDFNLNELAHLQLCHFWKNRCYCMLL